MKEWIKFVNPLNSEKEVTVIFTLTCFYLLFHAKRAAKRALQLESNKEQETHQGNWRCDLVHP